MWRAQARLLPHGGMAAYQRAQPKGAMADRWFSLKCRAMPVRFLTPETVGKPIVMPVIRPVGGPRTTRSLPIRLPHAICLTTFCCMLILQMIASTEWNLMARTIKHKTFWVFIVSSVAWAVVLAFLSVQSWVESIPFADPWAYFRNYHPVRYHTLILIGWASFGISLSTGLLLVVKKVTRRTL